MRSGWLEKKRNAGRVTDHDAIAITSLIKGPAGKQEEQLFSDLG